MQLEPGSTSYEVVVPGGTLAAQRLGDGEVAMLLHGGPGLSEYLGELAAEVRGAGVATLRYQQRGVSPSTVNGPFDVEQHAADAVSVLDAAEVERAWLVGHSWGGYLALQVATRTPERVRGVLAIGTQGAVGDGGVSQLGPNLLSRIDDDARAEIEELEAREAAGISSEEDSLRGFVLSWPGYFGDPRSAPPPPIDMLMSERCFRETLASVDRDAPRLATAIAGCQVRVVFLHGALDPIDPEASARATASSLPHAEVILLPAVGHFPWLERPGVVADAFAALYAAPAA